MTHTSIHIYIYIYICRICMAYLVSFRQILDETWRKFFLQASRSFLCSSGTLETTRHLQKLTFIFHNFQCFPFGRIIGEIKLGGSRRFQPAIYTVSHEESESEVQSIQILQENLKILISVFFYVLTRSGG